MKLLCSILFFLLATTMSYAQDTSKAIHLDAPELSTFKQLVTDAGILGLFQGTGPFTLFAPTNDAFAKLPKAKINELTQPKNKDQLVDLLLNHVVPGKYMARNLKTMSIKTIGGNNLHVRIENGEISINNAKVVKADLIGPNGVGHEIDTVLFP